MKILDKAQQFLGSSPLVAEFIINKTFELDSGQIEGKLQLLAKSELTVEKIHYTFEELFEQSHNNSTDRNKYILGEKEVELNEEVSPLDAKTLDFELSYDIEKGSYGDKRVYSGDMAVMNKLSDKAKKRSSTYKITATIHMQEEDKSVTAEKTIRFK